MKVFETEGETIRRWYCDHCGKRYDAPGVCTDGHTAQPVKLQEVDEPVNPVEEDTEVSEPTDEEKQNEIANQGKDVTIGNLEAHIKEQDATISSLRQYVTELEAKVNASETEGQ